MDTETKEIISESDSLRLMTEHKGWGIARAKLLEKITSLQTTAGLNLTDPQQLLIDVKANTLAALILIEWLKQDIEGTIAQAETNKDLTPIDKTYIIRQ